jgi:hypothetical protein
MFQIEQFLCGMTKDKLGIIYTVSLKLMVDKLYPPFPHQNRDYKTGLIHLNKRLYTRGVNCVFTAVSRIMLKNLNFCIIGVHK